jgi:hypothetical protein
MGFSGYTDRDAAKAIEGKSKAMGRRYFIRFIILSLRCRKLISVVTLTIPDSKPFVEFFVKLGSIISNFEKSPIYEPLEQIALRGVSP